MIYHESHDDGDALGCDTLLAIRTMHLDKYSDFMLFNDGAAMNTFIEDELMKSHYCNYDNMDDVAKEIVSRMDKENDSVFISDISPDPNIFENVPDMKKMLIDHHKTAVEKYRDYHWAKVVPTEYDGSATSATKLLYELMKQSDVLPKSNFLMEMAEALHLYDSYKFIHSDNSIVNTGSLPSYCLIKEMGGDLKKVKEMFFDDFLDEFHNPDPDFIMRFMDTENSRHKSIYRNCYYKAGEMLMESIQARVMEREITIGGEKYNCIFLNRTPNLNGSLTSFVKLNEYPEVDYMFFRDTKGNYSIRGHKDCTLIASQFKGGGGHAVAAGFPKSAESDAIFLEIFESML